MHFSGIVIGILSTSRNEIEVVFDDAWPGGTTLGNRCSAGRGMVFSDAYYSMCALHH